jgi:GNAT superfamily N-acetyltransferase
MNKHSFRRATPADAATVRDITHAAYAKWIPVIGRKPKPMTADYDKAVVNNVIDLLEEDGRPIALIEMIPELSFEPAHLLIENIAVMPERHGGGIGSVLLDRAQSIARAFGVNEMRLYFMRSLSRTIHSMRIAALSNSCASRIPQAERSFT